MEFYDAGELGELLRISTNRVIAMAHRREIAYYMIDGHMRFAGDDVAGYLKWHRHEATTTPRKIADAPLEGEPRDIRKE